MSYRIAVVVGSLRRASTNRALAHAVISLAPADFSFEFVEIGELPLYSQDYDADFPEVAKRFKQSIAPKLCGLHGVLEHLAEPLRVGVFIVGCLHWSSIDDVRVASDRMPLW